MPHQFPSKKSESKTDVKAEHKMTDSERASLPQMPQPAPVPGAARPSVFRAPDPTVPAPAVHSHPEDIFVAGDVTIERSPGNGDVTISGGKTSGSVVIASADFEAILASWPDFKIRSVERPS